MKKQEEITKLFKRYLANECSEEEEQLFLELFHSKEHESFFKELIEEELSKEVDAGFKNIPGIKAELSQVREKVIQQTTPASFYSIPTKLKIWSTRMAVAAMLVLCSGIGLYFYLGNHKLNNNQLVGDIAPGSNKALLTLADGSQIVLDEVLKGSLSNQGGVKVTKADDGQLVYTINETEDQAQNINNGSAPILTNTISTPRGGQYQVNLPDGTHVWLNAASELKFPLSFGKLKERRVELQGEAYFEVKKDATKPFLVVTDKQEVQVLGTHFNISSYKDELDTKTTLLEGSVKVSHLGEKADQKVLKPGEQSLIRSASNKISVQQVDTHVQVAWKDGLFFFENEPIENIMKQISRWYDVDVIYVGDVAGKTVWGSVTRFANVSKVLSVLELTGEIHFKVEGRRITVQK